MRIYILSNSKFITESVNELGILANDKNIVNIEAPTIMMNIILVVTLVSTRASISFFGSSIMFGKAKTKAPRAPIAAASVGVAIPA